jgi:hypothetical protein
MAHLIGNASLHRYRLVAHDHYTFAGNDVAELIYLLEV